MHSSINWVLVLSFVIYVLLVMPTLIRLMRQPKKGELSPEWLESFSCSRYRTMETLLSEEDFSFLASQPGFDPSLYRKLRRDRLNIFSQYLTHMITDFNRLHLLARMMIAASPQDRSGVLLELVKIRISFSAAVIVAQTQYFLCVLGLRFVNVHMLLVRLDRAHACVASLAADMA